MSNGALGKSTETKKNMNGEIMGMHAFSLVGLKSSFPGFPLDL